MEMKNLLSARIKSSIRDWQKSDIYAVSLFVYDNDDNPCEPTVTLGYNTNANYNTEIKNASDSSEAKWNYAFWLQNQELVFGIDETKPAVQEWIVRNGYSYEGITGAFIRVLVDVVKELHSSGFIKAQFGKELPVLIHELEYYDEIGKQNIEANTLELVEEFVAFCSGGN